MICERCHGRGFLHDPRQVVVIEPCPECNGLGIVSCCDAAGSNEAIDTADIPEANEEWFRKARLIRPE